MSDPAAPTTPQKRPSYESATRLAEPTPYDPAMKRPSSTVAGAVLVFLRAASGALVLATLLLNRGTVADQFELVLGDVDVVGDTAAGVAVALYIAISGAALLIQVVLGVLILRGQNLARVLVMIFSVISISAAFTGWWFLGQEIRISGMLLSVALDTLLLLALSSRSAAAYARRNQRPAAAPSV